MRGRSLEAVGLLVLSPISCSPVRRPGTQCAASRQRAQRRWLGWCSQAGRDALSGQGLAHLFPGGRGLCNARSLRVPGGGADQIRDPVACQPSLAEQDWLLAQASGRATSERGTSLPCQFQLSSGKLDQAAPGDRQGRVASGRALSARRLHRHQLVAPGRPGCRLLQQARHMRTMDQRGKRRDQVDAAIVPDFAANAVAFNFMRCPTISQFRAQMATPEPIKDWSLTSLRRS